MAYFVKLPQESPAFPLTCPFCNKRDAKVSRKVEKKQHKKIFDFKTEPDEKEFHLPICGSCRAKGGFFAFLTVASLITFFATLLAVIFYPPAKIITHVEMLTIFGLCMMITFAFSVLRHIHLNRFRVRFVCTESFTVQTSNKKYAQLLATRNRTEVVKKLFLFKPL